MSSAPEIAIIQVRNGASTTPSPAAPAAAAIPKGRQQATQDKALITAATGAILSECFTKGSGRSRRPLRQTPPATLRNDSVGTAKVPTKPLRCIWLFQVSPSPLPV